ncbi:MAG TPA: hypothetical protein VFP49_06310 [Nitrososphaeraceae archaeon]|nr:hypothetical protein [Nitrososphaeraceae archaeon]
MSDFSNDLFIFFHDYLEAAHKKFRKMDKDEKKQFNNVVFWLSSNIEHIIYDTENDTEDETSESDEDKYVDKITEEDEKEQKKLNKDSDSDDETPKHKKPYPRE